jgi:hypothetical protein
MCGVGARVAQPLAQPLAVRDQVVAGQVGQRTQVFALTPADQPPQLVRIGAPRMRRARRALAQEEGERVRVVGRPERIGGR